MQFNVFQINNYSNNLRAFFDLYLKKFGRNLYHNHNNKNKNIHDFDKQQTKLSVFF